MKRSLAVLFLVLCSANISQAVSLSSSLFERGSFLLGNVEGRSYDGPGYNAFLSYQPFTAPELNKIGTFTGSSLGASQFEVHLLSEVAYYDGRVPGRGNSFGVVNSSGQFISILGPADGPGAQAQFVQGLNEELTFAIKSPEGRFSSIDADNKDGSAHVIALMVKNPGIINIPNANLLGAFHSFNLQVGDIVLFLEDLLNKGNILRDGRGGDFDYNDMVVVIREHPIPEPGTVVLLSAGLFAIARRRRAAKS